MTYGRHYDRGDYGRRESYSRYRPASPRGSDRAVTLYPGTGEVGRVDPAPDGGPWGSRAGRRRGRPAEPAQMPLWQELPLLLVVAFCLAVLIRTFLLQAFFIPSGSMEDTLLIGDRVLVNKMVYDLRDPQRGEIVVFRGPEGWAPENGVAPTGGFLSKLGSTLGDLVGVSRPGEKDFIKRVIGLPGDKVACCDDQGRVTVNGQPLDEPYVLENSSLDVPPVANECRSRRFAEVTVPAGQIFVLGDHRLVSQDARCQGPVPINNVVGRAFVVVWPSDSWSSLPIPSTFDSLPAPAVAAGPPVAPLSPELVRPPAPAATAPLVDPVMLILLTSVVSARTRRRSSARQRRLPA